MKINKNQTFYIHDDRGSLMSKVRGYENALKAIKSKTYTAQLNYLDGKEFVMVYAHIPKGEKLIPSQMSSSMISQNIHPNEEIIENKIIGEDYSLDLFKNPATKSKAKQFGLIDVENNDLTLKGLIQKAIEWDEGEHGIEKFIYNQLKKDIEKAGGKMPKGIRISENKLGENKMSTLLKEANYEVEIGWKGLSGSQKKIGRFVVSSSVLEKIEKNLSGEIYVDVYDESNKTPISYDQVLKKMKETEYGKIAFKENINELTLAGTKQNFEKGIKTALQNTFPDATEMHRIILRSARIKGDTAWQLANGFERYYLELNENKISEGTKTIKGVTVNTDTHTLTFSNALAANNAELKIKANGGPKVDLPIRSDDKSLHWDNSNGFDDALKILGLRQAGDVYFGENIADKVNEQKTFNIQYNIGKSKYVVNYHDGEKKHKDGSKFYDIKIFQNKNDLENFTKDLSKKGYKMESINKINKLVETKMNEAFYKPKINRETQSISFVNDAEIKQASEILSKHKIPSKTVFGKTLKFINWHDFKEAQKVLGISEKIGESKMKITRNELKTWIREALQEETEYQKFFQSALDKFGAKSPADLADDKKKEFFDYVDANWKGEKENEVLEPVSQAAENPLKSVKGKKVQRILAQPYIPQKESKEAQLVRKLVREELRFINFADFGVGRKNAKRRITTSPTGDKKDRV